MKKFIFEPFIGEKWVEIKGFDGYYVSCFGRIWSRNSNKPRFLSVHADSCGYFHVTLYKNKKRYSRLVHRLVAEAYIDNPNGYKEVNHIDENKGNNRADNLEWCTRKYNILYGKAGKERYIKMGISQRYSRNDLKPVECLDAKTGEVLHRFRSIAEATRMILMQKKSNGSARSVRSNISNCCNNRKFVKTVFGYKWRFEGV